MSFTDLAVACKSNDHATVQLIIDEHPEYVNLINEQMGVSIKLGIYMLMRYRTIILY